jgi:hypothetical protein
MNSCDWPASRGATHYREVFPRIETRHPGIRLLARTAGAAYDEWSSNINEGDTMGNIDLRCSEWPPDTRRAKIEDRRKLFRSPQRVLVDRLSQQSQSVHSTIEEPALQW